ncbi:MAG: hypothetical protein M3Y81_01960 [Chloroflexota bacterium]|nr:hypothetical protein [Chloroflexota bacterium]
MQDIKNLKKCLKGQGWEIVPTALSIRVNQPTLVTSEAPFFNQAHIPSVHPLVAGGSAFVFSMLPVLRDRRKAVQEAIHNSPAAYLFYAEEEMNPANLMSRINHSAHRFFLGV